MNRLKCDDLDIPTEVVSVIAPKRRRTLTHLGNDEDWIPTLNSKCHWSERNGLIPPSWQRKASGWGHGVFADDMLLSL